MGRHPLGHRSNVIAGAALVAAGLALAALMHALPGRLNAPPAVGYVAALAFVVAGLLALSNAFAGARARAWLAVALLACLIVPGLWLAFGSGERSCTSGSFLVFFAVAKATECRAAFGVASAVGLLMLAASIRHALRAGRRADASPEGAGPGQRDHADGVE